MAPEYWLVRCCPYPAPGCSTALSKPSDGLYCKTYEHCKISGCCPRLSQSFTQDNLIAVLLDAAYISIDAEPTQPSCLRIWAPKTCRDEIPARTTIAQPSRAQVKCWNHEWIRRPQQKLGRGTSEAHQRTDTARSELPLGRANERRDLTNATQSDVMNRAHVKRRP